MNSEYKDRKVTFGAILAVIMILAMLIPIIFNNCPSCNQTTSQLETSPNSSQTFGNNTIGGCVVADAQLITYEGTRSQQGTQRFEAQAEPPQTIVNSTWDSGLDGWSVTGAQQDSSQGYFMSGGSLNLTYNGGGDAIATYTLDQEVDPENTFKIVFWSNISNSLESGEYYVLKVEFSGGDTLVYLLNGTYTPNALEKKIDVTVDLTKNNLWDGIKLAGIEEDYKNQFGQSSVPNIVGLTLQFHSITPDEDIHVDEFLLIRLPISDDNGFWLDDDGNKVIYAVVVVQWNVTISNIVNSSNVWLQLELSLQIEDQSHNALAPWDLAQVDLFQVHQFNTRVNWTSRTIELPKDDTVYGDNLYYNWTVRAHAFGQVENSSVWVSARGELEGFDIFHIRWIKSEGNINVELYVVIGSFGTLGAAGLASAAKKRKRSAARFN